MKTLSFVFISALAVAALGCKKKSETSASAGGDCAKAINHSMELSKAEMEKMGTDAAMMQKMVDVGIKRCNEDKWPADAIKCMTDAKTMADAQTCYGKLSKEQQDKMNKAAMELAMPAGGGEPGSAAAGSDAGSAAEGSAAGSDAGSAAAGSAAGSADAGSAGSAAAPQ